MKQIKTIKYRYADNFDHDVNAALAEGWELTKRELIVYPNSSSLLYAELEKHIEDKKGEA